MSEVLTAPNVLREHDVLFKSCIRCGGDRQVRRDFEGFFVGCLACGHVSYPEVETREAARLLAWKRAS